MSMPHGIESRCTFMIAHNNQVAQPLVAVATRSSYRTGDTLTLTDRLLAQGYRRVDVRSPHEFARLRRGASLIVVFVTGSILIQGGDAAGGHAAIAAAAGGTQ